MDAQDRLARENPPDSPCIESPISDEMFTSGPALAGFITQDRRRLARFTPRFLDVMGKLGMGARLTLPKLSLPILLVLATEDAATDNQETQRAFTEMTHGRVGACYLAGAHGLQFDAPDQLARTIVHWAERTRR